MSKNIYYYHCPGGKIEITQQNDKIISTILIHKPIVEKPVNKKTAIIDEAVKQFDEYFACKRDYFDLPLLIQGSEFRLKIYEIIKNIPYGTTLTYGMISDKLSAGPKYSRAIGNVCASNLHHIIIPCHRVVASNGKLGGYAAGIERKIQLLNLEKLAISSI